MPIASSTSTEKLENLLATSGLALHWRNNSWIILGGQAGQQRALPKALQVIVQTLIDAGTLVAGEDGAFRLTNVFKATLRRADETPFTKLASKREMNGKPYFDSEQIRAGEKLRAEYERAHLSPRVTANYQPQLTGSNHRENSSDNMLARMTEDTLAARKAVHLALDAVGPELAIMLLKICCLDAGFEDAERQLQLPRRAGKAVLAMALTRLARHYHFKPRHRHSGPDKIGHWAVENYRPKLMPRVNSGLPA